jgi:anti-anti-sigma regulatory factor
MGRVARIVVYDEHVALLRLAGDEDRATQGVRRPPLSRAIYCPRDLTVDLSELEFADASVMVDLAMLARRMRKAGRCMELRGARPHIQRLIELVGLDRLPAVRIASGVA